MNTLNSKPYIVLVGGSCEPKSISEWALRLAASEIEEGGGIVDIFAGPAIDLPMFAPESADRSPMAKKLVNALRSCDGIVIASPSRHGAMSGMMKNVLDYTEDMSRDPLPYFDRRAVGLIGTARSWHELGPVLVSMRSVVHALRGWPTPLGIALNETMLVFDADGKCLVPEVGIQIKLMARQVIEFARPNLQGISDIRRQAICNSTVS
jgi:FMN reductase